MFGEVKGTLSDLTSKLTDWKGPAHRDRVLLVGAGQLVIDGFITGLESRYDAVRDSLREPHRRRRARDDASTRPPSAVSAQAG